MNLSSMLTVTNYSYKKKVFKKWRYVQCERFRKDNKMYLKVIKL